MDEQIDKLNATADAELAAEQDLATNIHTALDLIVAETKQIADLAAQLAALQGQIAGGVVVPTSKIAALQAKMDTSVGNVLAQVAALKAALPKAPVAPTITTGSLPNGTEGSAYSFQFAATGDAPIAFASPTLPTGLSLASDGTLTGSPVAGTYSIDVTASNAAGSVTSTFTLTVDPAPAPVVP